MAILEYSDVVCIVLHGEFILTYNCYFNITIP